MKKIFISGSGGFIGSELANGFKKLQFEVHALDKKIDKKIFLPGIFIYKLDLTKYIKKNKLKNIDYFIHAAAITNPKNISIKKNLININLSLTLSSLILAKKMNVKKYYYISSTSIYGYYKNILYNDENTKPILRDDYSISKKIGENIVSEFCKFNKIDFKILRLGNIYSGFEKKSWSRSSVSFLQKWISNLNKKKFMQTNFFNSRRDWTFAKDLPLILYNIISSKKKKPRIINLVSPYIRKDIQIMKHIINKNSKMIVAIEDKKNKKTKIPTRSIYLHKYKFNNWTSPEKAINKIIKLK